MKKSAIKQFCFAICGWMLLIVLSCDKIKVSKEKADVGNTDTSQTIRKVLIEDYTGHTCGNCPRAAETAETLKQLYGEKVIIMGVHVGTFAKPCPSLTCPPDAPANSYLSDFRTTTGNDYNSTFGNDVAGLPNGMVNRKAVSGTNILQYPAWGSAVANIINNPPDAKIKITNTYNGGTRTLNTSIETKFLNQLSGSYKLIVLLTQDSIIDWQHDYQANPENIPNYVHRHVLRGAVNSSWGDAISSVVGATVTKDFTYVLNPSWDDSHCYTLVFICDDSTKEVIQVDEEKIK